MIGAKDSTIFKAATELKDEIGWLSDLIQQVIEKVSPICMPPETGEVVADEVPEGSKISETAKFLLNQTKELNKLRSKLAAVSNRIEL
ncbi:MAG: hypothetical protein ABH824_00570 [Nanoarchaeota archaeon]